MICWYSNSEMDVCIKEIYNCEKTLMKLFADISLVSINVTQ